MSNRRAISLAARSRVAGATSPLFASSSDYHVAADCLRILGYFIALLAIDPRHLAQHGPEAGPAVVVLLRREVGTAEEDFALGGEKRREGPTALARERLHGALVARIHVGPLVAIHLDAHEVAIERLGDARVLVRLAIHHVTPVAPHGADVQQDGLILGARPRERGLAPRVPVHRLVGGGLEVGGGFRGEEVRHRKTKSSPESSRRDIPG